MGNRICINAPAGIIEIEGDAEFIEHHFDRLMSLVESAPFGIHLSRHQSAGATAFSDPGVSQQTASVSSKPEVMTQKQKRPSRKRPSKNQTVTARVVDLRKEGFFKTPRAINEVYDELQNKRGFNCARNQITAALKNLYDRGVLSRKKENKQFVYYTNE